MPPIHEQQLAVHFRYPVIFSRNLLAPENCELANLLRSAGNRHRPGRVRVYVDQGLVHADPGLPRRIRAYARLHRDGIEWVGHPVGLPGGESVKNGWSVCRRVIADLARHRFCRHSLVLAIGGGAFLDTVGMGASLFHRGVRLVRIPTTVLSQADSGIGVKNGINAHGMKNAVGVFAPPFAVLIDPVFLDTLNSEDWIGGLAEAFKVAIIRDAGFFEFIRVHAAAFRARDAAVMAETVRRCALLHLDHIRGGDPFEQGSARPLDFGHWSAHRIETLSGHTIGHGMAVAVGIALDTVYACRTGYLPEPQCKAILDSLTACGLPLWSCWLDTRDASDQRAVISGLDEFREHLGGRLSITLPNPLGSRIEVHTLDPVHIEGAMETLAALTVDRRARLGGAA